MIDKRKITIYSFFRKLLHGNWMNIERIKEELTFLRLLFTVFSASFATLSGFLGSSYDVIKPQLLVVFFAIYIAILGITLLIFIRIINLLQKLWYTAFYFLWWHFQYVLHLGYGIFIVTMQKRKRRLCLHRNQHQKILENRLLSEIKPNPWI